MELYNSQGLAGIDSIFRECDLRKTKVKAIILKLCLRNSFVGHRFVFLCRN